VGTHVERASMVLSLNVDRLMVCISADGKGAFSSVLVMITILVCVRGYQAIWDVAQNPTQLRPDCLRWSSVCWSFGTDRIGFLASSQREF